MISEMVGIKYIVENLGLSENAIKQACQQENLLNTQKVGKTWLIHISECRSYWGQISFYLLIFHNNIKAPFL